MGDVGEGEQLTHLAGIEVNSRAPLTTTVLKKGAGDSYAVKAVLMFLEEYGFCADIIVQTDPEPAIRDLAPTDASTEGSVWDAVSSRSTIASAAELTELVRGSVWHPLSNDAAVACTAKFRNVHGACTHASREGSGCTPPGPQVWDATFAQRTEEQRKDKCV